MYVVEEGDFKNWISKEDEEIDLITWEQPDKESRAKTKRIEPIFNPNKLYWKTFLDMTSTKKKVSDFNESYYHFK